MELLDLVDCGLVKAANGTRSRFRTVGRRSRKNIVKPKDSHAYEKAEEGDKENRVILSYETASILDV
jgi:hypothetical protein